MSRFFGLFDFEWKVLYIIEYLLEFCNGMIFEFYNGMIFIKIYMVSGNMINI